MKSLLSAPTGLAKFFAKEELAILACIYRLYLPLDAELKELSTLARAQIYELGDAIIELAAGEAGSVEEEK